MLFANYIVLVGKSSDEVKGELKEQRKALGGKELRICKGNTESIKYEVGERARGAYRKMQLTKLSGDEMGEVER